MKIKFTAFLLLILLSSSIKASHLMGGTLSYEFLSHNSISNTNNYRVKLQLYRDCSSGVPLLNEIDLGVYIQDTLNPNADKALDSVYFLVLDSLQLLPTPSPFDSCNISTNVCVQEGSYHVDLNITVNSGGYHLLVQLNARNAAITNLNNPGNLGQTYYTFIPPGSVYNTSPVFSYIPVPFICTNDTNSLVNLATDVDGDSLSYSFVVPYDSYTHNAPNPPPPGFISVPPPVVPYAPTYSFTQPFGADGYSSINPISGLTSYYIPYIGFYVACVQINEYRNGNLISLIRRDYQLISLFCNNQSPQLLSSNLVDTAYGGQALCFPVTFQDINGDSINISASGSLFDSSLVYPNATMPDMAGIGIVSSQFCWTPNASQVSSVPYQFVVSATDRGCISNTTSQSTFSIYVLPGPVGFSESLYQVHDLRIFPNPASGDFTVFINQDFKKDFVIRIYSILGKVIVEKILTSPSVIINSSEIILNKGIYIVEINNGISLTRKKLAIE